MDNAAETTKPKIGAERVFVYMTTEERDAWQKAGKELGFKSFSPYIVFALTQFHRSKGKATRASV